MKPEDQHIALMESLGWTEVTLNFPRKTHKDFVKKLEEPPFPVGVPPGKKSGWRARLPKLTLDLMDEAEKTLTDEQDLDYSETLERVVGGRFNTNNAEDMRRLRSASAAERREAYLKTKGLWKES